MALVLQTHDHIVIDPNGDLMLTLYKPNEDPATRNNFIGADGRMIEGTIVATMNVSRDVLMKNSAPFRAEFTGGRWKETYATNIDMEVDTVLSVEIVMRALHGTMADSLNNLYKVDIKEIWEAIQYCSYRAIDCLKLKEWYNSWIAAKGLNDVDVDADEMKELLYPSYVFDHAKAFANFTKRLAYERAEHITESNPTDYRHLHLDGNAIGAINGAKGSLKAKLLRGLFDPVSDYLNRNCSCKENALFEYNLCVSKTGIWPLHTHYRKSVQEILDSPGFVKWKANIPDKTCLSCQENLLGSRATATRAKVQSDFQGLCLDCMKMTKTKDVDEDYWRHDELGRWSRRCRIQHDQPTWYFSFVGRKTDMQKHQEKKKRRHQHFGFGVGDDSD